MNKFETFWSLSEDPNVPEILDMYVYGPIQSSRGFFEGHDNVVTAEFIKDLRNHPKAETINVHINSPGGDVFAAASIRSQLRKHPAKVVSYIDGVAASAAVAIALGADEVHMSRSSLMMIHNPSTGVRGEVTDLEKGIEVLNKVKTTIVSIYGEKTGLDADTLNDLMDKETWLTADEAKEMLFIDKIIEDEGLDVENTDNGIKVNGVMIDFNKQYTVGDSVFCNNLSREKLENMLVTNSKNEGGKVLMDLQEFLNSMNEEQTTEFENYVNQQSAEKLTAAAAEWEAQKASLELKVQELEDAIPTVVEDTSEEAVINALPENIREMLNAARTQAAEAEAKLAEATEAAAKEEFKNSLTEYAALPLQPKHVEALYALSKVDNANFAEIKSLLKVANEAMTAGFTPIGSDKGVEAPNNAAEELNQKIAELRNQSAEMTYNEALQAAITTDPELYMRYRNELNI